MYLYSIIGIYNISFSDKISISLSHLTLSTTGDILYYCIWKFDHFKHITMHVVPSKHFFSFLVIVVNLNDVFPHKWMAMLTLSWQLSSCKELTLIIKSFFFIADCSTVLRRWMDAKPSLQSPHILWALYKI